MSCLPTATIFTINNSAEEGVEGDGDEEGDDFQTDEDEEMEVDKQVLQKRKKVRGSWITFLNSWHQWNNDCFLEWHHCCHIYVFQVQGGGFQKKFRNNHGKSGSKKRGKVWSKMQNHICIFIPGNLSGSNTVLPVWSGITVSKPAWYLFKWILIGSFIFPAYESLFPKLWCFTGPTRRFFVTRKMCCCISWFPTKSANIKYISVWICKHCLCVF